jgi:uncharacterized protein
MNSDPAWFNEGVRFSCQPGCVRCCGGAPGDVYVNEQDIRNIAAQLNMPAEDFDNTHVRHYSSGKMSLMEKRNGDCVLLQNNGCSVYSVRPQQCRDYPFWPEVMKSPFAWLKEAVRCPGINVGEHYDAPKIIELLKTQQEQD